MNTIACILMLTLMQGTYSFPTYDCSNPTVLAVHGLGDSECERELTIGTKKPTEKHGTLVQIPKFIPMRGKMLKMGVRVVDLYCSYFKLSSLALNSNTFADYTDFTLSAPRARLSIEQGKLQLKHSTVRLVLDQESVVVDTPNVDDEGFCKPHSTHIRLQVYKISFTEVDLKLHLNELGTEKFVTAFGEILTHTTARGDGYLGDGSFITWEPSNALTCPWEKVYSGTYLQTTTEHNSSLALFNSLGVGLAIKDTKVLCGVNVLSTSDNYLFILEGSHQVNNPLKPTSYTSWSSLVLTAVQYIEGSHINVFNNMTAELKFNQCKLEEQIRRDIIYGAKTEPATVAYRLTGVRGTVVSVAGAAIQILQCRPREAKLRATEQCFIDIPITLLDNSTAEPLYMDPVTHVLTRSTSRLPCHDTQNPFFMIREQFYKLTPSLQRIPKPSPLPSDLTTITAQTAQVIEGLYNHELTAKAETEWTYEQSKRAAIHTLMYAADPTIGHQPMSGPGAMLQNTPTNGIPIYSHIVFKIWTIANTILLVLLGVAIHGIAKKLSNTPAAVQSEVNINLQPQQECYQ